MRFALTFASFASFVGIVLSFPASHVGGTVATPLGTLTGTATIPGVHRFVFRYAHAARWRAATAVSRLQSIAPLPPICPQEVQDNSGNWTGQEDCLFAVLYVPNTFNGSTLAWFHGGTFLVGGANDPAIDGSQLALATKSIVAVVQYRLGVVSGTVLASHLPENKQLGFLPPPLAHGAPNDNLGVRDAILALKLLHTILPSFGGHSSVTVAGQSAGAMLLRAITAAPSASSLFSKVILHSDILNYGFYNASTLTTMQTNFFPTINCTVADAACQNAASLDTIMNAQLLFNPIDFDPSASGPLKFRPVHDGSLITATMTHSFPPSLKPLLFTTADDEGAGTVFSAITSVVPTIAYKTALDSIVTDFRADAVFNSSFYQLDPNDPDAVRDTLMAVVTDVAWRCSGWTFAKAWAAHGGSVFTGMFLRGGLHSINAGIPFCSESETHVCHTDDVPILFGTQANPSAAQSALIDEVQARWSHFIHASTPNPSSLRKWPSTTSTSANAFPLGDSTAIAAGACAGFWGTSQAPFDYQIWGL